MIPRSFFTGHSTPLFLSDPPRAPRSTIDSPLHRAACCTWSPGRFEMPATQRRLLMLLPALDDPPSEGRFVTW
jgi:hypothetical protein